MKRAHPLRSFRRAYLREAGKLPDLKRSGGWALAFSQEKPRLNEGPLFGSSLGELTGAEATQTKPQQRPARRGGRAEEPLTSPTSSPSGDSLRRTFRREQPGEPAPPKSLPNEAPALDLARWAGEKAEVGQKQERRKRESPASGRQMPDQKAAADHRREVATRSRRPLSVAGMPRELSGREESSEAHERMSPQPSPAASDRRLKQAPADLAAFSHSRSGAAPTIEPGEPAPRDPLSSLPRQGGRGNDPWGTLVSGAQAPRTLLDVPTKENLPKASPKRTAPPRPNRYTEPLSPGEASPSPNAANVSPFSHDRSSAPTFDSHEGRPSPFAPIAADPLAPHSTASPLGPFPNASSPDRALAESLQGVPSFSPLEAFPFAPSSSPDDLSDLAAKIDRILVDEARRHGIDV